MRQPIIRTDRIGRELSPVVVVEDFSPQPDLIVEAARSAKLSKMGEFYPGLRSGVPALYFQGLDDVLVTIMREVFGATRGLQFDRALFSVATTTPENLSLAQRIPHFDGVADNLIAIVHYLSPPGHGGTAFYRHRSTGFEAITVSREVQYLGALNSDFKVNGLPRPGYIDGDTALFVRTAAYEASFNRAVIYRGNLLHCAQLAQAPNRDLDIQTGRLTVASFLTLV